MIYVRQRLNEEWVSYLGNDWSIFANLPFRYPTKLQDAQRLFKRFFKYLHNPKFGNPRFYEKCIYTWVFYERNNNRSGVHIHALLRGINSALAPQLQSVCQSYFSPWSMVVPYDSSRGAKFYLADKINKSLEHYDFYKINSKWR